MSTPLEFCLALQRAQASLQLKLDDELGTHHGIGFSDFVLLDLLARAPAGRVRFEALVRPIGRPQSAVLRQSIMLEKIGLVSRDGEGGQRSAVLCPAGRALVKAAHQTVGSICVDAMASIDPASTVVSGAVLTRFSMAPALAVARG